jgi:uncharacterized membrane protein YfcA
VPFEAVAARWPVVLNLLAGGLLGAWLGAGWATRLRSESLHQVIAVLLVGIAAALLLGHDAAGAGAPPFGGAPLAVASVAAGFAIGVVASVLGVAGDELLIPTLVLLFGADVKLAGSLSLAVSLPTMLVGFARYSRDRSFAVLGRNRAFALAMAAGSVAGAFAGGRLLGVVPGSVLLPALVAILLASAAKVWHHRYGTTAGMSAGPLPRKMPPGRWGPRHSFGFPLETRAWPATGPPGGGLREAFEVGERRPGRRRVPLRPVPFRAGDRRQAEREKGGSPALHPLRGTAKVMAAAAPFKPRAPRHTSN